MFFLSFNWGKSLHNVEFSIWCFIVKARLYTYLQVNQSWTGWNTEITQGLFLFCSPLWLVGMFHAGDRLSAKNNSFFLKSLHTKVAWTTRTASWCANTNTCVILKPLSTTCVRIETDLSPSFLPTWKYWTQLNSQTNPLHHSSIHCI